MAKLRPESFPMTSPGMKMARNAVKDLRGRANERDRKQEARAKLRPEAHQRAGQSAPEPIPTIGAPAKIASTQIGTSTQRNLETNLDLNETYLGIGDNGNAVLENQRSVSTPMSPRPSNTGIPQDFASKTYNPNTGQTTTNMERGQQLVSKPKGLNRNMKKEGY
jgi:hypothetical protein